MNDTREERDFAKGDRVWFRFHGFGEVMEGTVTNPRPDKLYMDVCDTEGGTWSSPKRLVVRALDPE